MKPICGLGILFLLLNFAFTAHAQDDCNTAILLTDLQDWCSPAGTYTTVGMTQSGYANAGCWTGADQSDVWFQFTAIAPNLSIKVYGREYNNGTLKRPRVALYGGTCGGTLSELTCEQSGNAEHFVVAYRNGLVVGQTYFIRVEALNGSTGNNGTFALCVNNFLAPFVSGNDCATATYLCTNNSASFQFTGGGGSTNDEANNSCLDAYNADPFSTNSESNSIWLTWECGTAGTLDFIIAPTNQGDDLDFALYELPNGVNNCNGKQLLRCMASSCENPGPFEPGPFYWSGLDAGQSDNIEDPGCTGGSNNFVAEVNMTVGTAYALIINNYDNTTADDGFLIQFGGTGGFKDFEADFDVARDCGSNTVTFTDNSTNANQYDWFFGNAASQTTASTPGPHTITYPAGNHTAVLTITDIDGCQDLQYINFDLPISQPTISTNIGNVSCGSTNNGSITINVAGGTSPFEYSIDGGSTFTSSALSSYTFNGLTAGNYDVVLQDINSCQESTTVTVGAAGGFSIANINPSPATCGNPNGSISITVSGGTPPFEFSYDGGTTWFGPQAGATINLTGIAAGNHNIVVRDNASCTDNGTTTVGNQAGVSISNVSSNPASCTSNNGFIVITVSGGTSPYTFSTDGGTTFSTPQGGTTYIATGLGSGNYDIVVQDANVCADNQNNVNVGTQNTLVIDNINPSPSNCGASDGSIAVSISGGSAPFEFSNDNGGTFSAPQAGTSFTFNSLSSNTYTIVVRDNNGCTQSGSGTVNDNSGVSISNVSSNPANCTASDGSITITVSGGTGPYTFSTDGGTTFSASQAGLIYTESGLGTGNYNIMVQDANTCSDNQNNVNVGTQNTLVIDNINPSPSNCGASDGSIAVSISGGSAPFEFSNDNGSTFSAPQAGTSFTFNSLSSNTYTIVVRDNNGCTQSGTGTVNDNSGVSISNVSSNPANCTANDGSITITVSGGTGPYTFSTDGGTTFSAPQAGLIYTESGLGTGNYNIVVQDANTCSDNQNNVNVGTQNTLVIDNINPSPSNCGASDGSIAVSISGGSAPFEFSNDNGSTFSAPQAGTSFTFNSLSSNTYTIVVRDNNGCTQSGSGTVNDNSGVSISNVSSNPANCTANDGSITITVSGGTGPYTFSTDGGTTFSAAQAGLVYTENGLGTGNYNIVVQDANICSDIQNNVNVGTQNTLVIDNINPSPSNCGASDGSITVSISGGSAPFEFSNDNGSTFSAPQAGTSFTFNSVSSNTYTIVVRDNNGCTQSGSGIVNNNSGVSISNVNSNPANCTANDGSITITVSGGTGPYTFSTDGGTTFSAPQAGLIYTENGLGTGNYNIVVQDANICSDIQNNVNVGVTGSNVSNNISDTSCDPAMVGVVIDSLFTYQGCDSVVTITTTLLPSNAVTVDVESCDPADVGTTVDNLVNQFGCDSVVTTITTLLPSDAVTVDIESCDAADVGTTVDNLINQFGCDSVVTTITTLLPSDAVTVDVESCDPADVGTTVDDLINQFGCDSVVTTITTLLPSNAITVDVESCDPANVGTTVDNLVNQFGCDSIVTTITTLLPSDAVTVDIESCDPADVGTTVDNLVNQFGCDSIVTTITTLLPSDAVTVDIESCDPADVGTTVDNLVNQFGCDSIVTTITTLLPSDAVTVDIESCDPADVGTTVDNLVNQFGCDSIVTTITTLLPSDAVTIDIESCDPADVGTTVDNLVNQFGCDSVVTTITTLLPSDAVTIDIESCDPADVGTTIDNLVNQFGCDSVVTTITTLLPSDAITIDIESCNPADVGTTVNNLVNQFGCDSVVTTITTLLPSDAVTVDIESCDLADVGTTVDNLINQFGCDSVVTTITTLLPSDAVTIDLESCDPADVGTTVDNLVNQFGCDSVVTTITTLLPSDAVTVDIESCDLADVGTTVDNLVNQDGCDSIVTTITILLPSDAVTIDIESCDPADVGTTVDNLVNQFGCDSVVTTITTLLPSDAITIDVESCDPANVGTTVDNLVNQFGCDSVVTTITTLLPSDAITIDIESCDPADVGTTVDILVNQYGCDSVVTTITTLLPSDAVTIDIESCNPSDAGTTVDNLVNQFGCDSVVTVNTTLSTSYTQTFNLNTCDVLQVGSTIDTFDSTFGCDSIITTNYSLLPSDSVVIDLTSCDPANVGTTVDNFVNQDGCDSIVTTNTTLLPFAVGSTTANLCPGEFYVLPDGGNVGAGVYIDTMPGFSCDSIITITVIELPNPSATINEEICAGDSTSINGVEFYDIGGVYVETLTGFNCDSIVTLNLTITQPPLFSPSISICEGDSISLNGVDYYSQTGVYIDTQSTGLCDSIITLILTVESSQSVTVDAETCDPANVGTSIDTFSSIIGCDSIVTTNTSLVNSFIQTFNQTSCDPNEVGTTIDTLASTEGCDSIVTINTTLAIGSNETLMAESCDPNDVGTQVDSFLTNQGCDSIITTITTLVTSYAISIDLESCDPMDEGTLIDTLLSSSGCDSIVTTTTTLLSSYTIDIINTSCDPNSVGTTVSNLVSEGGCDSIITTTTTLSAVNLDSIIVTNADCNGLDGNAVFNINNTNPPLQIEVTDNNGNVYPVIGTDITLNAGDYLVNITDANNCTTNGAFSIASDSIDYFEVSPDNMTLFYGESVQLNASPSDGQFSWFPSDFLSCDACPSAQSAPLYTVQYIITRDKDGCLATDTVLIIVEEPEAFIPTAFTPNGDGNNDILQVMDAHVDELILFRIYNRWGELLFETDNINHGWDGTYLGKGQELDTYTYHVELIALTGQKIKLTGQVVLIR